MKSIKTGFKVLLVRSVSATGLEMDVVRAASFSSPPWRSLAQSSCLSSASKSVLLDFTSTSVICSVGRLARRGHSATHYHFTSIAVPDRLATPVLRPSVRPCQQFSIQLLQMSNLGSNRGSSYRWQTKRSTRDSRPICALLLQIPMLDFEVSPTMRDDSQDGDTISVKRLFLSFGKRLHIWPRFSRPHDRLCWILTLQ